MYKIGDKVKIKSGYACALTRRHDTQAGEIINIQENVGFAEMQVCRVLFGPSIYDYYDIADYKLVRVTKGD